MKRLKRSGGNLYSDFNKEFYSELLKKIERRVRRLLYQKANQRRLIYISSVATVFILGVSLIISRGNSSDRAYQQHQQLIKLQAQLNDTKHQKAQSEAEVKAKAEHEQQQQQQIDDLNNQHQAKKEAQKTIASQIVNTITNTQTAHAAPANYSSSLSDWLYKLRTCESGGNYQINTGNGFLGAYQFLQSTWNNVASRVRPDLVGVPVNTASLADQDFMIIANTNMSSGLVTQNPGCYASQGLSNYPPSV